MMQRRPLALAALALAGALVGCPSPTPVPAPPEPAPTGVVVPIASQGALKGVFSVPASIIGGNGSAIISHNGGGIISHNGGGLVGNSGGTYALLAVTQAPVAGAHVYLADAIGARLPGLPEALTDDQGRYVLTGVPAGYTFLVSAEADTRDGHKATFQTLASNGSQADIDTGTSLVAAAAVQTLKGRDLGRFDPASFLDAAGTLSQQLTDGQLPDFTSKADVQAKASQAVASIPAVQQAVTALGQALANITQPFANLAPAAASPKPATAPPSPASSPVPTPAPTPVVATTPDGVCSKPQEHYLQPLLDGKPLPTSWTIDITYPGGATNTTTDASGIGRAWVPVGCDLSLTLYDPQGNSYTGRVHIAPGTLDAHGNPIKAPVGR